MGEKNEVEQQLRCTFIIVLVIDQALQISTHGPNKFLRFLVNGIGDLGRRGFGSFFNRFCGTTKMWRGKRISKTAMSRKESVSEGE